MPKPITLIRRFNRGKAKRILHELHDLLNDTGFFLIMGTALGAFRDKTFTPTECDIDIGYLWERVDLAEVARRLIEAQYEITSVIKPFTRTWVLKATKFEIKTDIIGFIRWKNWRFCCSNLTEYSIVHEAALLERTQMLRFFDKTYRVPCPIKTYIEREYGPDWRTPKKDHVSKTRRYKFRRMEGIPDDLLESQFVARSSG